MSLDVLLVVITGGIDLSVGSVFSLTGMVTAQAMAQGLDGVCAGLAGFGWAPMIKVVWPPVSVSLRGEPQRPPPP
jgi:ribose/xylose/arabinose/galactoside ABC-type transport system permease subunit